MKDKKRKLISSLIILMLVNTIIILIENRVKADGENVATTHPEEQGYPGCPLGSDYFYMDFNPSSNPHTIDGGRFETETWTPNSQVTMDDFDDTDDLDWTNNIGIYSAIRNDEDLNDGTSADGAWCSCAKETGGAFESEDSRGWASVEKSFDLDDYVDTSQANFVFTDVNIWFDYKIYTTDFDDTNSYVYLLAYLNDGSTDWPLEYQWWTGDDQPNGGYCIDDWAPAWYHPLHPNVDPINYCYNDFNTDSITISTQGGSSQTIESLADFFNDHLPDTDYTLKFKLLIRLYGSWGGGSEWYKFWIDHVNLKCNYFINNPPTEPYGESPSSGSNNVDINANLGWSGGDQDGDSVTYYVYFGTTNPPEYVTSGSSTSYDPTLDYYTLYYWKIVSTDYYGATTEGDVWSFTTMEEPNYAPSTPSQPYREDGMYSTYVGTPYELKTCSTDPNGDNIKYGWDWDGDGVVDDWTEFYYSGTTVARSHIYNSEGTYYVKVKAQDVHDASSSWSTSRTITVTLPPNNPPTATIDSISPNPALRGEQISFTGTGTDSDGTIVAYDWQSDINGQLSTSEDFDISGLSVGVHTISFKVQDNRGDWSSEDTTSLTVGLYFIDISDPHVTLWDDDRWQTVLSSINSRPYQPEFVICTGDLVHWGEGASGLLNYLTFVAPLYGSNNNFFTDPGEDVPICFCPGNHDYRLITVLPPYGLDNYMLSITPLTYYKTTIANCAIFSMDSGYDFLTDTHWMVPEGSGLFSGQLDSLEYDLDHLDNSVNGRDDSNFVKIIFMHHPHLNPAGLLGIYDGTFLNYRNDFTQLCDQYNVNLVFYGHTHDPFTQEFDLNGNTWIDGSSTGTHYIIVPSVRDFDASQSIKVMPIPSLSGEYEITVEDTQYEKSTLNVEIQSDIDGSALDSNNNLDWYDPSTGEYTIDIPGSSYSIYKIGDGRSEIQATQMFVDRDYTNQKSYSFDFNSIADGDMNIVLTAHLQNGMWSTATYENVPMNTGWGGTIYADKSLFNYAITINRPGLDPVVITPTLYEGNLPPEKPMITGPSQGSKNKEITFTAFPIDPDYNDELHCYFDFGDETNSGWLDCGSGQEISVKHIYTTMDTWDVKVKVKDANGIESEWSDPLPIEIAYDLSFGNALSSQQYQNIQDYISGSIFCISENAYADSICAYLQTNPGSSSNVRCMIYNALNNELVGTTNELTIDTEGLGSWCIFGFDTSPNLQANTNYILVCWSDNPCNFAYTSFGNPTSKSKSLPYGTVPFGLTWDVQQTRNYSIYCSYSPIPQIREVIISPINLGFGQTANITTIIEPNQTVPFDTVNVSILYPDSISRNFTMVYKNNNTFEYNFDDCWLVGQFDVSIWVTDVIGTIGSSQNHVFNVSANAIISIATLKNSYSGSQYINITDPPNPPENYTLVGRGLTWDEYYNTDSGQNILEVSAEPINYQENNGTWIPINNSISQLASNHPAYVYGYRNGNNQGLYGAYFKSNAQNNWPVAFTYNRSTDPTIHVVRSKLISVGYLDPGNNWSYQLLQNVQNSQGQVNGNSIFYENVFSGTDVIYSYENTKLKENIILSNTTKTVLQNHPLSLYGCSNNSFLVFITKLDYKNLQLYNASTPITGNVTVSEGQIDFRDVAGMLRCSLPIGEAYELVNDSSRHQLVYRIIQYNGNYFLLSGLRVTDLMEMTFPVVIDPTQEQTTWLSITNDGFIYKSSSTSYNTAWSASTGTISSSVDYITIGQNKGSTFPNPTYYVYRGFLFFNTSSLPSNAYIDDATLSLYKKGDNTTTDFTITVQNGQLAYPHNPLQFGDYNKNYYSGNGGGLSTTNFVNGRNNITLTNHSWIQKSGMTKFCLRSNRDINGTAPTGKEYVDIYSREKGTSYAPRLIIHYRNQSKIKNIGSTDIKGYLLIQVQFYNVSQRIWLVDNDTVNETTTRTINSGSQLALDTIFNGKIRVSNLHNGAGTYRVYAAFRNPEGNILKTNTGVELKAWWQFSKT